MSQTKKTFDCVRSKRDAQRRIYEQIRGMTPEQEVEFFRRAVAEGPFRKVWERIGRRGRSEETPR